ncbi:MAG: hypothetical protein SGPRY_013219 [Prymnesium sp.]
MRGENCETLKPESRKTLPKKQTRELTRRVQKGIPEPLRGKAWLVMSGAQALMSSRGNMYTSIRRKSMQPGAVRDGALEQIEKVGIVPHDLKRTFPKHVLWTVPPDSELEESPGVQLMRNILRSYALYDQEVVYCQVAAHALSAWDPHLPSLSG